MQNTAPMFEQQLACGRGRGAAAIAGESILSQLDFKQAHLGTARRLGDIQRDGRAGKTAKLGHAYEKFKLFEVHGGLVFCEYHRS